MIETLTCPHCQAKMQSGKTSTLPDATVATCKTCQQKFALGHARPKAVVATSRPLAAVASAKKGMGWPLKIFLGLGGMMLLMCSGCLMLFSSLPKPSPPKPGEVSLVDEIGMQTRCERQTRELISAKLKAPTTAKFELKSGHFGHKAVVVTGVVTSQNSFSAMITDKITAVYWWDGKQPEVGRVFLGETLLYSNDAVYLRCKALMDAKK
jgi:hypothetical protein